jgi:hypothetical protein
MMNAPSLSGFLDITQAKYRLFDLGTMVRKLPSNTLKALDDGQPYPLPHLGFGWLVIFLWNEDRSEQNSLWFLKLPLDEQGALSAAVHSDLVNRLYKALQTADEKERQRLLTDHPYQFTPEHEKMASLHARATDILGLPPSNFFEPAKQFYLEHTDLQNWTTLGIQGIADFVVKASEAELIQACTNIDGLDDAPKFALLQQLEHCSLPTKAVESLVAHSTSKGDDLTLATAILKACAQSAANKLLEPAIRQLIQENSGSMELLLTVITRYASLMKDEALAIPVLDQLATLADSDGFARVMTNLAMQPGMQGIVMKTLGSTRLTEVLANALSRLIQQKRGGQNVSH